MTPQELSDRLWQFAARIGKVVDALPNTRVGRDLRVLFVMDQGNFVLVTAGDHNAGAVLFAITPKRPVKSSR